MKAEESDMTTAPIHLLLMAVVQEQDQDSATRALGQLRLPVVYLASAGGFLGRADSNGGAA